MSMPLDDGPSAPRDDRSGPLEADVARLKEMRALVERMTPEGRAAIADLLRENARETATERPRTGRRGTFGLLAGQFSIGPEFFEPLPEEELRAWGEL